MPPQYNVEEKHGTLRRDSKVMNFSQRLPWIQSSSDESESEAYERVRLRRQQRYPARRDVDSEAARDL